MEKIGPFMEVAHSLYSPLTKFNWDIGVLFNAVRDSEVHLSGWPIGVVLTREGATPKARKFGLKSKIVSKSDGMFDYWELHKDGKFYFKRTIEEAVMNFDGSPAKEKVLLFDTRIRRITEALLHCQKLYENLNIDPKQTIHFSINHFDLNGRILTAGSRTRSFSRRYDCVEDVHKFDGIYSIELIVADLNGIVYQITKNLFELFNWFDYQKSVCDDIVDKFLEGKY